MAKPSTRPRQSVSHTPPTCLPVSVVVWPRSGRCRPFFTLSQAASQPHDRRRRACQPFAWLRSGRCWLRNRPPSRSRLAPRSRPPGPGVRPCRVHGRKWRLCARCPRRGDVGTGPRSPPWPRSGRGWPRVPRQPHDRRRRAVSRLTAIRPGVWPRPPTHPGSWSATHPPPFPPPHPDVRLCRVHGRKSRLAIPASLRGHGAT